MADYKHSANREIEIKNPRGEVIAVLRFIERRRNSGSEARVRIKVVDGYSVSPITIDNADDSPNNP